MNVGVRRRLAGMMALIYAVQGAWWPLLAVHLGELGISGRGRGWIFAALSLASLATPLGAGQLADRFIPTQFLLAFLYTCGTGLLVLVATGSVTHALPLFVLFLVYWLLTAPSNALSSALALRNLPRPHEQFGRVRLWGTVGWMVIGWVVSAAMEWSGPVRTGQGAYQAFWIAAGLSGMLALYCLSLPHTPPLAAAVQIRTNPFQALSLTRSRPVAVYLTVAFGVSLTTPFVYQVIPPYLEARGLARAWISSAMTLGQIPEIGTLAVLPWLLRRYGYRGTLGL